MCDKRCLTHQIKNLLGRIRGRIFREGDIAKAASEPGEFKLGNILIAYGQITRGQLDETIEQQKHTTKKVGELLVERGYVQQKQVEQGLHLQQLLISAALGSTIVLSGAVTSEAGSSITSLTATATVKSTARMAVKHQTRQIVITDVDIAHGFLEVPAASRIEVKNSSLFGYIISFEALDGPFSTIVVKGLGREMQLASGNSWLLRPYIRGTEMLELTYRFILRDDARPGTYPWPLQMSVAAV
jgi:hypothetical protein